MKVITSAVLVFSLAVTMGIQMAHAQEVSAKPAPIEAFFCNFQPNKGMQDLVQVAQRFSAWADKTNPDYSAWILTPQFGQFADLPQVVWLGSNASGNTMGKGLDAWQASGGDIQAAFDGVVACNSHSVASSIEVSAPDGPPGDGVVMFTQCKIAEGSDWEKAVAAHKKYAASLRGMGAKNSNWVFFPMLGGPAERGFDYWGVATFKNWADYFSAYEIYVSGGGWQKGAELMKGVASCGQGSATVWDVKLVRQAVR
ncbi:MAG: hypothetical protein R3E50_17035 [Halioglobus sp.]